MRRRVCYSGGVQRRKNSAAFADKRRTQRRIFIREEQNMKLIIQVPCYNEAETLKIALDHLPKHIDGIDQIEYLIINDGSKDRTVEVAKEWGINYVVNFKRNKGLARGFMAGLDACLRAGADIIVNTDADDQYCGDDIEKLVRPILEGKTDIVIGERPIDQTEHFSPLKKKLQHFGSWTVRVASNSDIPDAPSGFRAYSREAAMQMNVINEYTYTLETIVQAGRNKIAMTSVPIRTNPELRKSRLFSSMFGYVKRSMVTIVRSFLMYQPLKFFSILGGIVFLLGALLGVRFLVFFCMGSGSGHVQSLILASTLLMIGFQTLVIGLLADTVHANRRILEDIQYRVRKMDYELDGISGESEDRRGGGRRNETGRDGDWRSDGRRDGDQRSDGRRDGDRRNDGRRDGGRRNEDQREADRRNEGQKNKDRRSGSRRNDGRRSEERKSGDQRPENLRTGDGRTEDLRNDSPGSGSRGNEDGRNESSGSGGRRDGCQRNEGQDA